MKKVASLVFLFLGMLLSPSCKKEDIKEEEVVATCTDGLQNGEETGVDCGGACDPCIVGPPSGGYYFYGIIDGKEVVVKGGNAQGSGSNSCGGQGIREYVNGGIWVEVVSSGFEVTAETMLWKNFSGYPSSGNFYAMFAEGNYSYDELASCTDTNSRAVIGWLDDTGEYWSSARGAQPGSEYEITKRGTPNGISVVIEGKFKCKLYSSTGNKVKTIESGQFRYLLGLF